MTLDIAMGGSTNTVLHLLAAAHEGEVAFTMQDIDRLSRRVPELCKVAPSVADVHVEDVHRAGGILAHPGRARPRRPARHRRSPTVHAPTLAEALERWDVRPHRRRRGARRSSAPRRAACRRTEAFSQAARWDELDLDRGDGRHPRRRARLHHRWRAGRALRQPRRGRLHREDRRRRRQHPASSPARRASSRARTPRSRASSAARSRPATWWSSATKARGRPRHAGDALPDQLPEIEGPRARPARWSPTAASPAARPACRSATSRRRRPRAARSRWSRTATASRSTSPVAHPPGGAGGGTGPPPRRHGGARRGRLAAGDAAQAPGFDGAAGLCRDGDQRGARRGTRPAAAAARPGLRRSGTAPDEGGRKAAMKTILDAVGRRWQQAFARHDAAAQAALYTEDALFYGGTMPLARGARISGPVSRR